MIFANLLKAIRVADESLTLTTLAALEAAERNLRMVDAAVFAGHSTAAATGLVDRMERRGLIIRQPRNGDRRVHELALTKKGQECLQAARNALLPSALALADRKEGA